MEWYTQNDGGVSQEPDIFGKQPPWIILNWQFGDAIEFTGESKDRVKLS